MTTGLESLLVEVDTILSHLELLYSSKTSVQDNRNDTAAWKDEILIKSINQLKIGAECVSSSMTKLHMVSSQFADQLPSLLPEVSNHINVLIHIYFNFTELNSCQILFKIVYKSVRTLYLHIQEHIRTLMRNEFNQAKSVTGLIWKSVKEIDELPLTNKGAFRRDFMEDIATVADTFREFEGYLSEADNNLNNSNNNNDVDDDDDDDDDDGDDDDDNYSSEEIPLVRHSVDLFTKASTTLKLVLQIMTYVADQLCTSSTDTLPLTASDLSAEPTVFNLTNQLQSLTITNNNINSSSNNPDSYRTPTSTRQLMVGSSFGGQIWVSELTKIKSFLVNKVTDLGCELYPPVVDTQVQWAQEKVLHYCFLLIDLLCIYECLLTVELKNKLVETKQSLLSFAITAASVAASEAEAADGVAMQ